MKNIIIGAQATAIVFMAAFTYALCKGEIASVSQACIERPDYVSQLASARGK
jgi:hypothetical protein